MRLGDAINSCVPVIISMLKEATVPLSIRSFVLSGVCLALSHQALASEFEACMAKQMATANDEMTIGELRKLCEAETQLQRDGTIDIDGKTIKGGVLSKRIIAERQTDQSEFVLTPHHTNYFLPVYSTSEINPTAYGEDQAYADNFKDIEAKFQISFKFPLSYGSLLFEGDRIYGAFTLEAWWQVYADDISSPFRETNYRPEFFYVTPLGWHPFDGNTGLVVGVEHQSNGRSGTLSRSWNRVYAELLYENGDWLYFLKPWYRIQEDEKLDPSLPEGDDNPDIADYMGHAEFGFGYDFGDYEMVVRGRQNFSTNKGAIEVEFTTPLYGKLHGYVLLFNGYGDSLIDYNHSQTRLGVGIALNNMF